MRVWARNTVFLGVIVGVVALTTSAPGLLGDRMRQKAVDDRILMSETDKAALKQLRKD